MAKKAKKEKPAKATKKQNVSGMSLPGAQRRTSPQLNVYAALAAGACVALAGAVVVVGLAAIEVGPGSDVTAAVKLHPERGQLRLD